MKVNWTKEFFERAEDVKRAIVPLSTGKHSFLTGYFLHTAEKMRETVSLYIDKKDFTNA